MPESRELLKRYFNQGGNDWLEYIESKEGRAALTQCITDLEAIEALCRRYNSPATEPGAHALAGKILKIIEGKNA